MVFKNFATKPSHFLTEPNRIFHDGAATGPPQDKFCGLGPENFCEPEPGLFLTNL